MSFNTAIFDLDGTLLDSLDDIAFAGNHAMTTVGRPTYTREQYSKLAGQGLPYLIEHALGPEHQDLYDTAIAAHREYYATHLGERSTPFEGTHDMLDTLKQRGMQLAVLSNKPHAATREDVKNFFGLERFELVIGHRDGYAVKPDPTSALEMIETLGTTADQIVYIGDTAADMKTGKAAGFYTIGVTWGFRDREELEATGADVIVESVDQLVDAIASASNANQSA